MDIKVALVVLLAVATTSALSQDSRPRPRHVKRHLEEFLEPPPPPPTKGITTLHKVTRSRRGGSPALAPAPAPAMSLGERIARWFYAGSGDPPGPKQHGHKPVPAPPGPPGPPPQPQHQQPTMMGLSPPPPPAPPSTHQQLPMPGNQHTAEAAALTEQKPPPPQVLHAVDQHTSATEHQHGYQPNNYPVLMPQSYLRQQDCNPCNNVPWVPMQHSRSQGHQQDSYGPPGESWGQASDAVPLAQAPIPFPALHKSPLPPVFPADDFSRVPPEPPARPVGLRDHLVPPTPEHDSVVFTINEEKLRSPEPVLQQGNDLEPPTLKSAVPDQQHQGSHTQQHSLFNNLFSYQPYGKPLPGSGVELVQSVPVASYLASVEYPMTYIQSPLIEIPVKSIPAPAPHGFVPASHQLQPLQLPQPSAASPYRIVAPTPSSDFHGEKHAGSLPLQGEAQVSAQGKDSAPSSSIQHQVLPPCMSYHLQNDVRHQHVVEDAATANSHNSHAITQEANLPPFESQRIASSPAPAVSNAQHNNYRHLESEISPWPSTTPVPLTSPFGDSPSTGQDSSGFSSPGPHRSGTKKTKQIQIIVPYTIDKDTGQLREHGEFSPEEFAGSEGVSFTAPPSGPGLGLPADLPTGLEALLTRGRKVPADANQVQAQESVVVAELSPTPWQQQQTHQQQQLQQPKKNPTVAANGNINNENPFAGLQHILTTDLRTLLRSEEDSVDRLRLQKNIDNWTAQEYSLKATRDTESQEANPGFNNHFSSTTAAAGSLPLSSVHGKLIPSKKIPKEYLTTTPLSVSSVTTPTSTTTSKPTTRRKEHPTYEALSTKRPSGRLSRIHPVKKNATRDDRKTKNGWTLIDNLVVPGPAATTPRPSLATTTTQRPASSPSPGTTVSAVPENHRKDHTRAPWERLQVSISPLTQEKVYVVTPLSLSASDSTTTESPSSPAGGASTASKSINDLSPFRQWMDVPTTTAASTTHGHQRPRFSIRPTPGWPKARPHGFRSSSAATIDAGTTVTTASADKETPKSSRQTPRGFAVETISGHSKVFTATTSTWSKKKAVSNADGDKKTTTAKPTTASVGGRTTRALKAASKDLSDIDAEASASVLHRHVAQLFVDTTTEEHPSSFVTPAREDPETTAYASAPEIVIVESRRETPAASTTTESTTTETSTPSDLTTSTDSTRSLQRTTRAVKTIGRRPDGVRYILSEEEARQSLTQPQPQRTKLHQAVTTLKKYESPPPRPKVQKGPEALFRRKPSRRPPHLVLTPDRGSYLWNFSEFSETSHEDMAEDDASTIKGVVVELKKEPPVATAAIAQSTTAAGTGTASTSLPVSSSSDSSRTTTS